MTNNKKAVPQAKQALNQMKLEIANELGLSNYESVDKGNLTARQNGYVGGNMTKKLVEMAQQQMSCSGQLLANYSLLFFYITLSDYLALYLWFSHIIFQSL